MKVKKSAITVALLVVSLALMLHFSASPAVGISNPQILTAGQWSTLDALPFSRDIVGKYVMRVAVNPGQSSTLQLQVIPDDRLVSLSVDGVAVDLSSYDPSDLSDWSSGVIISLDDLTPGKDHWVKFDLVNRSNPAGLDVRPYRSFGLIDLVGVFLGMALLCYALQRHISLSPGQWGILFIGLAVSLAYLSVTDPHTRTFDVYEGGGHRDYINYIIQEHALPPPGGGWEYHQPPMYYLIAAGAKAMLVGASDQTDRWGQLLALWFWTIFLFSSLGALRISIQSRQLLLLSSFAVCLWPSGIIHSIRIGNDVPLYAFYGLSFYYVVKWWRSDRYGDYLWACAWACASLLTKSNGMAVWGILGVLTLIQVWREFRASSTTLFQTSLPYKLLATSGTFFILAVAVNLGDNIWHYVTGSSQDWLLSNVGGTINPKLTVENDVAKYLIFDLATYLENPFIDAWNDAFGRQYFWNYVWRSSLTSEYFFEGEAMKTWSLVNGVLLLIMLSSIALLLLRQVQLRGDLNNRRNVYRALPWVLAAIFPFLLLLAYRIKVPLSCNTDFRYIYPVIVPLVLGALVGPQASTNTIWKVVSWSAPAIGAGTLVWVLLLT